MTTILAKIGIAALLSLSSLTVILLRVSPLTSPGIAIPFFFLTLFLFVSSISTLLCYAIWHHVPMEGMDAGRRLSVSLREGLFFGCATTLLFAFLILGILTWWIGILIYSVFALIELALHS